MTIKDIPSKESVVFFDCDDTLILWGKTEEESDIKIKCPYYGTIESGKIHKEHVQRLKDHKKEGHYVIVWSQGGIQHARSVVEALKIQDYVDLILEKPLQYYDDLDCQVWMGTRTYLGDTKRSHPLVKTS